jgi:single-stranded-DNA-specific exonuclease
VLADRGWHAGVIGIVAGRLAEKFNRPTIMIALDQAGMKPGMGSARTISGVDLYQTLSQCSDYLETYGGHKAAAGLRIREENLDAFRQEFLERVSAALSEADLVPELEVDSEVSFSELSLATLEQMERLAPFGQGNPRPVLFTQGVHLAEPPKRMGGGERHLSVNLQHRQAKLRGVAFGKGEWAEDLTKIEGPLDVAFRPVVNEFRGYRKVELHLLDWRPSATA